MPNYSSGHNRKNNRSPKPRKKHFEDEIKIRKTYHLTEYAIDMIERLGGSYFLELYTRKVGSILAESEKDCY